MSEANRVPLTIRLRPEDKAVFVAASEQAGIEAGIAARTVLELVVRHLRTGRTFFQTVGDVERAIIHAELAESDRALATLKSPVDQAAILARVEALEASLLRKIS